MSPPPGGLPQRADRLGDVFHTNVPLDNSTGAVDASLTVTAVLPGQGPNGEDIVAEQTRDARVEGTPQMFSHDDDGNLLFDGRWTYAWNGENRLVAMESANARLEFVYDYVGRRVEKPTYAGTPGNWTLAGTRRFMYDGWNLIAEFNHQSEITNLRCSHVWGLDLSQSLQGAGGVGGLLRTTVHDLTDVPHYPVYDGNGNVMRYLTGDGTAQLAVSATLEYSPFGRPLQATGDDVAALAFRFSTKYTDAETGLVYYGYRYYQPGIGRWLSRDPIEEAGGENLNSFLAGDPTNSYDLLGWALKPNSTLPSIPYRPKPPGLTVDPDYDGDRKPAVSSWDRARFVTEATKTLARHCGEASTRARRRSCPIRTCAKEARTIALAYVDAVIKFRNKWKTEHNNSIGFGWAGNEANDTWHYFVENGGATMGDDEAYKAKYKRGYDPYITPPGPMCSQWAEGLKEPMVAATKGLCCFFYDDPGDRQYYPHLGGGRFGTGWHNQVHNFGMVYYTGVANPSQSGLEAGILDPWPTSWPVVYKNKHPLWKPNGLIVFEAPF